MIASLSRICNILLAILCFASMQLLTVIDRLKFHSDTKSMEFDAITDAYIRTTAINRRSKTTWWKLDEDDEDDDPSNVFGGGVRARAFPKWPVEIPLPCFHPTDGNPNVNVRWTDEEILKSPSQTGLLFTKLPKTASSTASGIHLRVATNVARRRGKASDYGICKNRYEHGTAGPELYDYGRRDRWRSFLWTLVRHPTTRAVSEFFHFRVSRHSRPPTLRNFRAFLRSYPYSDHYSLAWLSTLGYHRRHGDSVREENEFAIGIANDVIRNDYDFVGVTERLDESAVALMMLLNLPMADILYVSTKSSGGYDDGAFENRCVKIQKKVIDPEVQAYLDGPEWQELMEPELALYQAANRSLDLTIDRVLGREAFEAHLERFQRAQAFVQEQCAATVKLPCTRTGERLPEDQTDCLRTDSGCGFDCLDRVATQLDLW